MGAMETWQSSFCASCSRGSRVFLFKIIRNLGIFFLLIFFYSFSFLVFRLFFNVLSYNFVYRDEIIWTTSDNVTRNILIHQRRSRACSFVVATGATRDMTPFTFSCTSLTVFFAPLSEHHFRDASPLRGYASCASPRSDRAALTLVDHVTARCYFTKRDLSYCNHEQIKLELPSVTKYSAPSAVSLALVLIKFSHIY